MSWAPSKKLVAQGLYESGHLRVIFDPQAAEALIPEYLKTAVQVAFDYGAALAKPTTDAVIDDDGIHATLSFDQTPFYTSVPWSAVFCVLSPPHGTVVWPADVPKHVVAEHAIETEPLPPPEPAKKPRPAWLKAVD